MAKSYKVLITNPAPFGGCCGDEVARDSISESYIAVPDDGGYFVIYFHGKIVGRADDLEELETIIQQDGARSDSVLVENPEGGYKVVYNYTSKRAKNAKKPTSNAKKRKKTTKKKAKKKTSKKKTAKKKAKKKTTKKKAKKKTAKKKAKKKSSKKVSKAAATRKKRAAAKKAAATRKKKVAAAKRKKATKKKASKRKTTKKKASKRKTTKKKSTAKRKTTKKGGARKTARKAYEGETDAQARTRIAAVLRLL